jgi:zinc protease
VALVKDQQLGMIRQALDDPETIAGWVAMREYFGPGHPFAHAIEGSEADVQRITRKDIVKSWKERFQAGRACFVVAGDVDTKAFRNELEARFGSWEWGEATRSPTPPPKLRRATDHVFVDHPGATQSVLYVVLPSIAATDNRLQPAMLGITALGGTFTSRLMRLLREEKGYTYGVRAWIDSGYGVGTLEAKAAVRQDVTALALQDLLGEMTKVRTGIEQQELDKARGARRTAIVEGMATRGGIASIHATLYEDGRPPHGLVEGMARLEAATLDQVNAELEAIDLTQAVIVVVGDLSVIRTPIEAAVPGPWRTVEKVAPAK